jgi:hypothetical protein
MMMRMRPVDSSCVSMASSRIICALFKRSGAISLSLVLILSACGA